MIAGEKMTDCNRRPRFTRLAIPTLVVLAWLAVAVEASVTEAVEIDKPLVVGLTTSSSSNGQNDKPAASESKYAASDAPRSETKSDSTKADDAKPAALPAQTLKPLTPTVGSPEERSATALAFVRQHHPELVDLLERLKASNVTEYERAIRELARTSDRLGGMRERNPERYALELESWKLKSQIQLLAARASLSPNEDLTSELRDLITRQLELRVTQLEQERSELVERLDRVELAIETAEVNQQTQLDKQLNDVLRGIDVARKREADRRAKKPGAAGSKTKRDNKKDAKKTLKPEVKGDVKKDAGPDARPDAKKDSDK